MNIAMLGIFLFHKVFFIFGHDVYLFVCCSVVTVNVCSVFVHPPPGGVTAAGDPAGTHVAYGGWPCWAPYKYKNKKTLKM